MGRRALPSDDATRGQTAVKRDADDVWTRGEAAARAADAGPFTRGLAARVAAEVGTGTGCPPRGRGLDERGFAANDELADMLQVLVGSKI